MATDKSLRQHYAIQGGGPNYLGKQKMVKAPKKWKSSPDHEPAELAYITKKEKDILLDLNLYGSLKNGKPNRGPSGIISLQGDMGSVGGGGGGGNGGGWNPGVAAEERAQRQAANDRARENAREMAIQTAAKQSTKTTKTGPSETKDRPTSFLGPEDLKQKKATVEDAKETYISETGKRQKGITHDLGDGKVMEDVYNKPEEFTDEELEKGITKDGKTIEYIGDQAVTNKSAKEFNLGLKERNIKTGEIQQGRNIINPYTQQLQSKFAPIDAPKKGLWGMLGTAALGILAPALLPAKLAKAWSTYNQFKTLSKLASSYVGKDYVQDLTKNLTSKSKVRDLLSRKTTTDTTTDTRDYGDRGDGRSQALQKIAAPKADVVTESVQKFIPSKEQLTEVQKRRATLQGYADKGALNERGQNTLLQMNQFLEKYLVSVAHGGFIDRPLMGRSRDI